MYASNQAAQAVGQQGRHVDFRVTRKDEAFWTIEPLSEKAKTIADREFGLDAKAPQDQGIVTGYARSNALLHSLRVRGYAILYIGPAGPITL
jgi:hypothetical protein